MRPRASVTALLALLVLVAGCGGGTSGPTASPSSVASPSPSVTPTPTPGPVFTGSNEPDPDKRVTLSNEWTETVAMDLRVVRVATNETVHEATYDLAPGEDRAVYSTAEADPEGIESFRVVVTARDRTRAVTIETSTCYGGAYGVVRSDGTLDVFYAVC